MAIVRLEARELAIGRGGARLLEGLSLTLEDGERVALTGRSGVGKTTALRALAALDPLFDGTLALDGAAPEAMGVPRWRRRVTYVAQRAAFFGGTVAEELARPFGFGTATAAYDEAEAAARLARLHLDDALGRDIEALSEGERQRVALVRALGIAPDVLLLDEPTSALDSEARSAVERELAGRALVVVTHDDAWRATLDARPIDLGALR